MEGLLVTALMNTWLCGLDAGGVPAVGGSEAVPSLEPQGVLFIQSFYTPAPPPLRRRSFVSPCFCLFGSDRNNGDVDIFSHGYCRPG